MKQISKLTPLVFVFFPAMVLAAPISTQTGFIYPANMTHADSSYIGFGDRNTSFGNRCHLADDYSVKEGSTVYATTSGVVERASNVIPYYGGDDGRVGSALIIKHLTADKKVFYALYGHIKNRKVEVGENVNAGQKIAEVGHFVSSNKNLPHLHFGINTIEPSYHGYTPTAACNEYLGFVDPEEFITTYYAPGKTCNAVDNKIVTIKNKMVTTENVFLNDTATVQDTIHLTGVDSYSKKNVSIINNNDGTFTYTPPIDFVGNDSFTYTISDNKGCSDTATVYIEVKKPSSGSNGNGGNSSGGGSFSLFGLMGLVLLFVMRLFRKTKIECSFSSIADSKFIQ
jgi:hypothetical protein